MIGRCEFFVLAAALATSGCAGYPVNPPLAHTDRTQGYRFDLLALGPGNTDETFGIVTLSGGGTRAAALAYGVFEHLRDTRIGDSQHTLLDEVDVISSVSGGSFAAAYYGLFGPDRFFAEFPDAVLRRRIESDLYWRLLAPWNWVRLLRPSFGRGDLADEYYDHAIFAEQTFSGMRRERPFILLNATDVGLGMRFAFTQEQFDALCSDLDPLHVSRGVTASSAFPVAFQPLTFHNRPKQECDYATPRWVENGLADRDLEPRRYDLARAWKSYEDQERRPYVHLMDGGLADNIGLRGPYQSIATTDGELSVQRLVNNGKVQRLVVISVDARPGNAFPTDRTATGPRLATVLAATGTVAMERYSLDSVELLREYFEDWQTNEAHYRELRENCDRFAPKQRERCYAAFGVRDDDAPPFPKLYFVHVRLDALADCATRERLQRIPTSLQLSEEEIQLLIYAGHQLLDESEDFQRLKGALGVHAR